ncbi:hypothetical protein D9M73_294690 [compost metagenome]
MAISWIWPPLFRKAAIWASRASLLVVAAGALGVLLWEVLMRISRSRYGVAR